MGTMDSRRRFLVSAPGLLCLAACEARAQQEVADVEIEIAKDAAKLRRGGHDFYPPIFGSTPKDLSKYACLQGKRSLGIENPGIYDMEIWLNDVALCLDGSAIRKIVVQRYAVPDVPTSEELLRLLRRLWRGKLERPMHYKAWVEGHRWPIECRLQLAKRKISDAGHERVALLLYDRRRILVVLQNDARMNPLPGRISAARAAPRRSDS